MRRRCLQFTAALSASLLTTAVLVQVSATPATAAFASNDYCLGECSDILPPGQNGDADLAQILAHQVLGTMPPHADDQLAPYANLAYHYTGLTPQQINTFFNDSSYGVAAANVASTVTPRSDVSIVRDKALGIPHVTGTTRAGTMFGAGYAGGQDRLFLMDLLRHVARGSLTSFAGGAVGNRELEQSVWRNSPYTEADLQAQIDALRAAGTRGAQLYDDVVQYLAGVNRYIDDCMAARDCPGEYVLTGHLDAVTNLGGPEHFTPTDLIATAGVIGGLFGGGGGTEMQSALVRVAARAKYGATAGDRVWRQFREQNDPETVLTLHNGQSFPYGAGDVNATGVAMPDPGPTPQPIVFDRTGSALTGGGTSTIAGSLGSLTIGSASRGMSNAAVVSAANSATGHPVAVFGPQTGYFAPQLLMLQELQGPGISSRGVAFSGLNLYTLLGRGPDYAWSATSSIQDITDTYAVRLCNLDGSVATTASTSYLYHGTCTAMENLTRTNSWKPTTADSTAAGSYRLTVQRTRYGLVTWRGTVGGAPVAFTGLRATYGHEADSAVGFQMFNEPEQMGTAAAFTTSASHIVFAFNWFYVNSTQNAMYTSGAQPVRPVGADPELPTWGDAANEWTGWNGATAHPQAVNQDYFVSWNNKQAGDFSAADGNFSFGAVHRADLLDAPLKAGVAAGVRYDRASLLKVVEQAALTDLRGREVLPVLLRVIDTATVTDAAQAAALAKLRAWLANGAVRRETAAGSKAYVDADAIRIFDAWWPKLVQAAFTGGLGDPLFGALVDALQINESPSGGQTGPVSTLPTSANESQAHKGSAFQYGWWGYVSKDLRAVLGDPVPGWSTTYCGGGAVGACRGALLSSLGAALSEPATVTYPGDTHCSAGDQWCADAILQSPLGGITHGLVGWQNRPTYQQVVSFPARRGDSVANLAAGRPGTASSNQSGYPAGNAVDGRPDTRWASSRADNQWLQVDLGAATPVARAVISWESAYAKTYRIETSPDGTTWTLVAAVAAGDGGTDGVALTPTTARYVRLTGLTRATGYGFSVYEMEVYSR
ncbi:penicillin acylase [Actinoplanes sp. SE50]|uniref:penicillin acylase family protein n=1 Tax=unclassified Actinoplanes TaxID=2626549 RepID=UPI00023EC40D|nr:MULTISPECIES: penicillin acylase family protein [unclassified Actinoplanes]AEV83031.1 penicillin acylase [Actinoplanes sp. SE50/110]ATO81427.1 penicillin acylase [Actinoplanes sp. SE50]SLL98834.1 penicillin acylase [Actinoplanes sp. SE50/110]